MDKLKGLKNSTRASNPEGLFEKEIKARSIKHESPKRYYKKRRLNELTYMEIDKILRCYLTEPLT